MREVFPFHTKQLMMTDKDGVAGACRCTPGMRRIPTKARGSLRLWRAYRRVNPQPLPSLSRTNQFNRSGPRKRHDNRLPHQPARILHRPNSIPPPRRNKWQNRLIFHSPRNNLPLPHLPSPRPLPHSHPKRPILPPRLVGTAHLFRAAGSLRLSHANGTRLL